MTGEEFKKIREDLGFSRLEFASLIYLSGYMPIANIENGSRNPSNLTAALLFYLESLSSKEQKTLINGLLAQEDKVLGRKKGGGRGKSKK